MITSYLFMSFQDSLVLIVIYHIRGFNQIFRHRYHRCNLVLHIYFIVFVSNFLELLQSCICRRILYNCQGLKRINLSGKTYLSPWAVILFVHFFRSLIMYVEIIRFSLFLIFDMYCMYFF